MQSRQLRFLKDYQENNERHWEANDDFLHQLSEKVDELSESGGGGSSQSDVTTEMARLSTEVASLRQIVARLQDELLQADK